MDAAPRLNSRDHALALELFDALLDADDLHEVLQGVQQPLSRLLPADCMALCISKPGQSFAYDWMLVNAPPRFFARYGEVAEDDFVRRSVMGHPNRVMRDSEMLSRQALKRSKLYQYCRQTGMPTEYVMAVMLDVNQDWHGGLTLYREGRRRFSDRERALLQWLTPRLAKTVRDRRMLGEQTTRGQLLDSLFTHRKAEALVLTSSAQEILRTPGTTALLSRWFTPLEYGASTIPQVLLEQLAALVRHEPGAAPVPDAWERERPDLGSFLNVVFSPLPSTGGCRQWALFFTETPRAMPLPAEWRPPRLTPSEADVVLGVLQGWDNQLIAEHLGNEVATVKKHLYRVFNKLGLPNRNVLMSRAALLLRKTRS